MPPKKKEKGGKGGKGAGAVPNALAEPPQPAAGTPFCLSLVLDVSLLVDPGTAEPGQRPESGGGGGGGGEDAQCTSEQQSEQLLVEPVFRYTFVNGERITTPPIGLAGSSWTRLNPGAATADASAAAREASGAAEDGEAECDKTPSGPVVWRYTRTHQLHGADDDEV